MIFRWCGLAIAGTLLLLTPEPTRSADVSGVVLRPPARSEAAPSVNRYREHRGRAKKNDEFASASCQCNPGVFAVVKLTGENLPSPRIPLEPPVMAQKERRFEPSVLAVPVGSAVAFPNYDPFFHNVFSYSKVQKFDLGRYAEGKQGKVVFERPGIVPIFCEIHYSMRAYVHVVDSPYFAVSDERREWAIADVLPGDYELHVWQEGLPEIVMPLTVGTEAIHVEIP